MRKLSKDYDSTTIPDKIDLLKELSKANKLRHQFWSQLRAVRNQIGRYIYVHEIQEKDFDKLVVTLPEDQKECFECEWQAAKNISIEELEQMFHIANLLWRTSQFTEELRRAQGKALRSQDIFFQGPVCKNCGLSLTGNQRKFCSTICGDQHRKREDAKRRRTRKKIGLEAEKRHEGVEIKTSKGPNPQLGEGERRLSCSYYATCLDNALNWTDFHCESCALKNH